MRYKCSATTDLDDLLGSEQDSASGYRFRYGPIPRAIKNDEELVLENSAALSELMLAKIRLLIGNLMLVETEERMRPGSRFRLIFR